MPATNDSFTILLIDSDEQVLDSLSELLEVERCQIHTAKSGAECIVKISNGIVCPDLLIAGHHLKDQKGIQVIKRIRQFIGEEIPAIIFSDDESAKSMEAARQNQCIFIRNSQAKNNESGVYHLVYVSDATHQLDRREMQNIAEVSQKNNLQADVTEILMFRFGKFMQFLEGPENEVRHIFSVIQNDPRHTNLHVLKEGYIPKRQFADWHMRYTPLSDIQVNEGIIFRKLFDFSASAGIILESAKESLSALLAFKNNHLSESSKL